MAILKNTVQVNSGNTGWTRSNVLDALEETIADLGWNSGSQVNGVVTSLSHPANSDNVWNGDDFWKGLTTDWNHCGGPGITIRDNQTLYYSVDDSGTGYVFKRYYYPTYHTTNTVAIGNNSLAIGDPLVWRPSSNNTVALGDASDGDTVYVAQYSTEDVQNGRIKLAPTQSDAIAGTNLLEFSSSDLNNEWRFYDPAHTDNTQMMPGIQQDDTIYFDNTDNYLAERGSNSSLASNPLWFQDTAGAYDADRVINNVNYQDISSYRSFPSPTSAFDPTTGTGYVGGQDASWNIDMFTQGTYYITSQNDATYSVSFTLNPAPGRIYMYDNRVEYPYYDYTVPQDGARSALNLRIYREDNTVPSKIAGIRVMDLNSTGWSESDTFTIPGTAVGGVSPTDDILVGASSDETSAGASDGTAGLHVCNLGAGVNALFKNPSTNRMMIKLENDAGKTYGYTHYLIELVNDYTIEFRSGISPKFLGFDPNNSASSRMGRWGGEDGFDYYSNENQFDITGNSNINSLAFATSSTPTSYPLKIVSYNAQSPQDTDFAIIQFIQTINGNDVAYATWWFHKGNNYGNGIWDMDYVWQGGLSTVFTTTSYEYAIGFYTSGCQGRYYHEPTDTSNTTGRVMREALYGYFRSPTNSTSYNYATQIFAPNMWANNSMGFSSGSNMVIPYFRHNEYDDLERAIVWDPNGVNEIPGAAYSGNKNDHTVNRSMPIETNYYRPIKGLPITTALAPCPYYLPDDFVMIQFDISPGLSSIRTGDTITISASEVYEVVRASYENNDETYDGITDNRTRGIIFGARTT